MTRDEFREHLDLYSADLSRWPVHLVKPALALTESDPEARRLFDAALRLDETLRAWQPRMTVKDSQIDKIVRAALAPAAAARNLWVRHFSQAGGGLVALALLGFIIGISPPETRADWLMDPVFYAQDQIIGGDIIVLEEGLD